MSDNVTTGTTGLTVGADEVTDGTLGTIKVQYVKIMDGTLDGTSKATVGTGGLAVAVSSSTAVIGSVKPSTTWDTNSIQSGTWNIGTVSTITSLTSGTVTVTGSTIAATQSGTWTVSVSTSQLNTLGQQTSAASASVVGASDWTQIIGGDVSAASTDSGKPVKIGGIVRTGNPTALSSGERCNAIFDPLGKQIVVSSIRALKVISIATSSTTTELALVAAGGSGVFVDLYGFIATNTSTQFVMISVKDTSGGTTQFNLGVPSGDSRGFTLTESAALPQGTANKVWTTTLSTALASGAISCTGLSVKNV